MAVDTWAIDEVFARLGRSWPPHIPLLRPLPPAVVRTRLGRPPGESVVGAIYEDIHRRLGGSENHQTRQTPSGKGPATDLLELQGGR
jgi:hypothetical protein